MPPKQSRSARNEVAPTIGAAILSHYGSLAAAYGVDIPDMLRQAGVDRRCLVDPATPLSVERASLLIALTAEAAGSDTFGLELTLGRGTPDLGPLNLLLREEPTLGAALQSLERYFHVHSTGLAFPVEVGESTTAIRLIGQTAALRPQAVEMILCGVLQTFRWLLGTPLEPVSICFRHDGPADKRRHRQLLAAPVSFAQSFDGIVLDSHDLDRPIAHAQAGLRRHAELYVRSLAEHREVSLIVQVERLASGLLPSGRCSAATVAGQLGISRITLGRRLARHQTSFSEITDRVRRRHAEDACRGGLAFTRIAEQLGYSDLSNFSRWFSKAFGCSPREWRNRN